MSTTHSRESGNRWGPSLAGTNGSSISTKEPDVVYSYGKRERLADTVGSAVTVITADVIEAGQYAFAADALKEAPGVVVARNGAFGGFASARIRGASSGQTLVVIDGIVMNDPSAPQGGFNFADLDVADIERIEVLRGPQSLIYGADAIGGVIAIRTKRGGGESSAYAEGGAHGSARGGATFRIGGESAYARATISGATTDGISRAASGTEADGFRNIAGSLSAGLDIGPRETLEFFGRASDSRAELDGFPPPFFALADTEEIEDTRSYSFAARFAHGGFDDPQTGGVAGALTFAFNSIDRADSDRGVETFAAKGERFSAEYAASAALTDALRAEAGAEYERAAADVSGVDETAAAGAVYALLEADFHPFVLSAGARRDEFSNFDGATTARVAGVFAIGDHARLRASWGEGFRAPTLFELNFDQFGVVPNPDLRPERARGVDAGVDLQLARVRLSATVFRQRVKDQIDFDFARNGFFNIDRVKSRGAELDLDADFSSRISARVSYAYIDAEDATTGARIPRTPKHSGAASFTVAPVDDLLLSASLLFNGREADLPTPNDSFVRLDLRGAWSISDALQVYARLENATGTDYQDVSGYAEPGASAFAGIRVRR